MALYTVFGGRGFIGGTVATLLRQQGHDVQCVGRDNWPEAGSDLGEVIFTIGMTADFRKRLVETVEMQVIRLHEAMTRYRFGSFLYLSSGRVYTGAASTKEDAALIVRPTDVDHVYNTSKLAAESLCFAFDNPRVRVARLSNIFGVADTSNLFLTAVMREALTNGHVTIGQSERSSKDYLEVGLAAEALVNIATRGEHRIYNVAAGQNLTHRMVADVLNAQGYGVTFREGGAEVVIPEIDTSRYAAEFGALHASAAGALARVFRTLHENKARA